VTDPSHADTHPNHDREAVLADGPARPASAGRTPEESRTLALSLGAMCRDDKCTEVAVLDLRGLSSISDYLVIATGTSDRQMAAVLHHLEDLGEQLGQPAYRTSRDERGTWLVADFVDVVVHLFEPNTRAHYDLELLWGDAKRLELPPPGPTPATAAKAARR
jgi:ribosome-associated protein